MNTAASPSFGVLPSHPAAIATRPTSLVREEMWRKEMEQAQMASWPAPAFQLAPLVAPPFGGPGAQAGDASGSSMPTSRQEAPSVKDEGIPAPVHVHAEVCGNDVHVWIGGHGDSTGPERIGSTLAELRRSFDEHGQRLSLLVCNGRIIYQADVPDRRPLHAAADFADAPPYSIERIVRQEM